MNGRMAKRIEKFVRARMKRDEKPIPEMFDRLYRRAKRMYTRGELSLSHINKIIQESETVNVL